MKFRILLLVSAGSVLMASPVGAAAKNELCPADLASAKAVTVALSATGEVKRSPGTGYERVTYENTTVHRAGRPVHKVVVERSGNASMGRGHYQLRFFAAGTATDLIADLKAQLPAAKCENDYCSGSAAVFPGAEGSLEYGAVTELQNGKVEVLLICKYRDDAYGKLLKDGGLAGSR